MRACLMTVALKAADLGHPARPLETHRDWVRRCRRFWAQGDRERAMGEEPPAPSRDRKVGGDLGGAVDGGVCRTVRRAALRRHRRAASPRSSAAEAAKRNLESWGGRGRSRKRRGRVKGGGNPRRSLGGLPTVVHERARGGERGNRPRAPGLNLMRYFRKELARKRVRRRRTSRGRNFVQHRVRRRTSTAVGN